LVNNTITDAVIFDATEKIKRRDRTKLI